MGKGDRRSKIKDQRWMSKRSEALQDKEQIRSVNRPNKEKVKDRDQNKLAVKNGRIERKMHSPESWEMDKSMYPPDMQDVVTRMRGSNIPERYQKMNPEKHTEVFSRRDRHRKEGKDYDQGVRQQQLSFCSWAIKGHFFSFCLLLFFQLGFSFWVSICERDLNESGRSEQLGQASNGAPND